MQGTCRSFKDDKGYGFIEGQDRQIYFCHQSAILMPGWRRLERGQEVEFDAEPTDRGPKAVNIYVLDNPEDNPQSFREQMVLKESDSFAE